jgi:hypothetical protein
MSHKKKHRTSFSSVVKSVNHEVGKITKPIVHIANKEVNTVSKLGSEAIHAVGSVGQSLALPLILIGGVAVIYIMTKK